jgi:TPP-dependent pyruvate/acetoin dehydrogenase alpha subunit
VDKLISIFHDTLRIRKIEEEISLRYSKQEMRCPTHLSIGQEATPSMVCQNLTHNDLMVGTHRSHAHYLAKGGDLNKFIAELHGKSSGCTSGRGGSMNLSDLNVGFVASTAIVANTVPIGVGLAFAQQLKGESNLTCVCLGDAAFEEGVTYESLNFAALKGLPVLFICENNFYSVNTPLALRQPAKRKIADLATAIGIDSYTLDGNNTVESYPKVADIIATLREKGQPQLIELETYRYKVHCGPEDEPRSSRPEDEVNYWLSRDPVTMLQNHLLSNNLISQEDIDSQLQTIKDEIDIAFSKAEAAPFPLREDAFKFKYATPDMHWLSLELSKQAEEVLS